MAFSANEMMKRTKLIMAIIKARPEYLSDSEALPVLTKAVLLGNTIIRQAQAASAHLDSDTSPTAATSAEQSTISTELTHKYCQFLIEFSYAIEVKLVNEDFSSDDANEHIAAITGYLDEVIDTLIASKTEDPSSLSPDQTSHCLELKECAYWRKGALMYMYCHTARDNEQRLLSTSPQKQTFLDYASTGVCQLAVNMRATRCSSDSNYTSNDEESLELIQHGMYSDTHVLACMYAAELCYWMDLMGAGDIVIDGVIEADKPSSNKVCDLGHILVSEYLKLANGPLKRHNWNTTNAEKILSYFQSRQG